MNDLLEDASLKQNGNTDIPVQIRLQAGAPGFFFGVENIYKTTEYIGMPQGAEGNFVIIGGNGSGKSSGIAKPTLSTWKGTTCVTDIKGELSKFYKELYHKGAVTRPYIIFDPKNPDAPSYDPFEWIRQDDNANLISNIWEITIAIIPNLPDDKQPFWNQTEQGLFAAAILYDFKLGLSFSEAICKIMSMSTSALCTELKESNDSHVNIFLGESIDMKGDVLAAIDRGLRNKLMLFAADPYISHAFRGRSEGAECFTWSDLDKYNIFYVFLLTE